MKKHVCFSLAIALLMMMACQKESTGPEPGDPNAPKELVANAAFHWKTTKTVTVSVTGTPVNTNTQRKFSIQLEDGSLVYEGRHSMKDNFQVTLTVPAYAGKLIYKYGSLSKEAAIADGKASMDYLVETDNGYIP